jgi:hypothetical protein
MTPLTAEKIAELEGLPARWRADASGAEGYNYTAYEEGRIAEKRRCAAEIERLIAPFLSLAKRVAGAPVACHRTYTGKTDQAKWSWIDGPASPGAIDQARLYGWRIENAYVVEIVGGEEGNG